ncbi:MAG TPA: ParA family protein [Armatimonadota bacterium]|jgi:chromosome partitioning protein|nr:ParA family protein [Armatimonadota bacterium]
MKILSIVSHKGGAGKTSSAVMLAEDIARRGHRVVLVDADRQRGAGLLLGIDQPTGSVQQTRNPRLRYFCTSGLPLRELPTKAAELAGLFDVAVVDTPSLDDPLARGWIQLSSHALMVLPVEPVSLKTLDAAGAALDTIQRLNDEIKVVGTLPTMFDENDTIQRTLMLELRSRWPEGLLARAVPMDSGLAHRAEQKAERRTDPAESTRLAYQSAGDVIAKALQLDVAPAAPAPPAPAPAAARQDGWAPSTRKPDATIAAAAARTTVPERRPSRGAADEYGAGGVSRKPNRLGWGMAVAAVVVLLVVGLGWFLRPAIAAAVAGKSAKTAKSAKAVKGGKSVNARRPAKQAKSVRRTDR